MELSAFTAATAGGTLGGWVVGEGPRVLLLHGGPGVPYDYLEPVIAELRADFRVAVFQQRGLQPSTLDGPFTIEQAIEDVVCVLDALDWPVALVVGHSWGAHLALRFAAAHPERLLGMLAIDPIGIVGDGGAAAFEAEILARVPLARRRRVLELDELEKTGELSVEQQTEMQEIIWPSYFADPEDVPPMPPLIISMDAYLGLTAEMSQGTEEVSSALATGGARYGVLAGGASPIPWGQASQASAELCPNAFLKVVPGAGHFVWYEAPGAVGAALQRLTSPS